MDVDENEEEKMQVLEDVPMSPAYMFSGNSPGMIGGNYGMGTKGVQSKRRGGTRTKQTARKSVGAKVPRRGPLRLNKGASLEDSSDNECVDELFAEDLNARRQTRTPFQQMDKPHEYCEMHYYASVPMKRRDLITDNKFWLDLANHIHETKSFDEFMSGNFFMTSKNASEIILSCAFLDLPFTTNNHKISTAKDKGLKIKFDSNAMLFKKQIKKATAKIGTKMHAIHRYFLAGSEHDDTPISAFLTHQIYGCEVIVTNVSSKKQNYQLLWQIPEGSLPLQNINYQKSTSSSLKPYSTKAFKYYFYFPSEGEFVHFPSNVSIEDKVDNIS